LLGCNYIENGNNAGDIWSLNGNPGSFTENKYFEYGHIASPKCRPDVISAGDGLLLFNSQDTLGYAVAFDNGSYKVITSSFILGGLVDGDSSNTKIELMKSYLSFFEGTLSVKEIQSISQTPSSFKLSQNYPNPFNHTTLIKFTLTETTDQFNVSVFNMLGQEVARINNINSNSDNYTVIWDGTDKNKATLPSATYIYQLKVGNRSVSRSMNLVR